MKVFWSWQSDTPANLNKNFVKSALENAIQLATEDLDLSEADRPELDHDTKGAPGLVSIVDMVFKKIEEAALFVGDITFVGDTAAGKRLPNPNVMIELGHAITSIGIERIILVTNSAYGCRPEDLPFDLRHRRGPIAYNLPESATLEERQTAKKKLTKDLWSALSASFEHAIQERTAEIEFPAYPAQPDDRAMWLAKGEPIKFQESTPFILSNGQDRSLEVLEGTRSYLRIVPARLSKVLTRRDVQEQQGNDTFLCAMGPWRNGDIGANALGVVAVGLAQSAENKAVGAAQFFIKTGEIWGFTSEAAFERDGKVWLYSERIPIEWLIFFDRAMAMYSQLGVSGPFQVEAGVTSLGGVVWGNNCGGASSALETEVHFQEKNQNWEKKNDLNFSPMPLICCVTPSISDASLATNILGDDFYPDNHNFTGLQSDR